MIKPVKFLRILCVLTLAALSFTSCASKNDEDFPFITVSDEENTLISEYRVIVSNTASGEVLDGARILKDKIMEQTGVEVFLNYDNESIIVRDGAHVIYVGYVDYPAVRDRLRNMRSLDYICRSFDDHTLIGGRSDEATVAALERFTEEILPASDSSRLIPEGGGFEFTGEYSVDELYVDSLNIRDFEIIVDNALDHSAVDFACSLRDRISEAFGYWLDVRIGEDTDSGRCIYVLTDSKCQGGRAELERSEKGITLKAADRTGLARIVDTFLSLLSADGTAGTLKPSIPNSFYIPYGNTECAVGAAVFDFLPNISTPAACANLKKDILEISPDILICGNVSGTDAEILRESLNGYNNSSEDGEILFYLKEVSFSRISMKNFNGTLCHAASVKCGELEFILIYTSGNANQDVVIDVREIVGETPLPVVAVSYMPSGVDVTFESREQPLFEKVVDIRSELYKKSVSYVCYTDLSRLSVTVEPWDNMFGLKAIRVTIP